jgi:hypothetical protein
MKKRNEGSARIFAPEKRQDEFEDLAVGIHELEGLEVHSASPGYLFMLEELGLVEGRRFD